MPLVPASHLWGYLLCIVVMCTYQILLIHSTWCLRVSGWDILYCTALQALLRTCVQLLRTQIKIKHTFVIQERGCGRNRQVLSSYLPKQSFKLTGRPPSQQMKGKTIHERDQISTPGFHTYHTLTHSDVCLNTHGEEKRKQTFEMHTRAGTDYDETRPFSATLSSGYPFPSLYPSLYFEANSMIPSWLNAVTQNPWIRWFDCIYKGQIKLHMWDKTIYRCWHTFKAKVR